jgi:O-antigen/teichoic acid export membrane protein
MTGPGTDAPVDAAPGKDLLDSDRAGPTAVRGGAVRALAFVATVLISVGSSALLFRHLGVARSGDYAKVISLVTLWGGFTDAGLSAIGVRELTTRGPGQRAELMRSLGGLRLVLAFIGVLGAVAFAALADYGPMLVFGAAIVGVGMLLMVMQDTYAINLTAQLRIAWVAAADALRVTVLAIGIVALVLAGSGLLPFYVATIPGAVAAAALTAWLVRRDVPLLPTLRLSEWRVLMADTLTYSLATAVAAVYFRVAIIVMSLVSNKYQTGYFSVPFRVMEVLSSVPALLVAVAFPIFARAARDDLVRLAYAVGQVFDALWLMGLAVALALYVGAPFIIAVVGGPHFRPSAPVLEIQGLALAASFVGAVWGYTLLSLHRHREILIASLTALAFTVVLTGVLGSRYGARGAAIGTAISEYAFVLMLGVAVFKTGLRPAIHWHALGRSIVAVALGAATLAIPGLADVVRLVLALGIYGAALVVLRAIPRGVIEQLPWAS